MENTPMSYKNNKNILKKNNVKRDISSWSNIYKENNHGIKT
jgi:hypothetical protein